MHSQAYLSRVPAASTMIERAACVESYYPSIDLASQLTNSDRSVRADAQQALRKIIDLFEPTATYNRAGLVLIGRDRIQQWLETPYPQGRLGFIGRHHQVKLYHLNADSVFATGVFTRTDGWSIKFADRWDYSPKGLNRIALRTTYLGVDSGHAVHPETRFAREGECAVNAILPTETFQLRDGTVITFNVERRDCRDTTFVDCGHWGNNQKERYFCDGFELLRPAQKG